MCVCNSRDGNMFPFVCVSVCSVSTGNEMAS